MMQNGTVAVSVVIPCYRCANTIQRAVDSVLYQTRTPTELILVDDASDDRTLNVLRDIKQGNPGLVKIIALDENHGAAMNMMFTISPAGQVNPKNLWGYQVNVF